MRQFNVNTNVKVKLTEYGIAELRRQHDELNDQLLGILDPFKNPVTDEEGRSSFQLHDLMHRFGHMMTVGNSHLPFECNDLYLPESNN